MSKQREALEMALQALEEISAHYPADWEFDICIESIKFAREALAEPEQEPATWQYRWLNPNKMDCEPFEMDWKAVATGPGLTLDAAISDLEAYKDRSGKSVYEVRPLYTAPPARKLLTDNELWEMWVKSPSDVLRFARAIERAHGIGVKE